MLVRFSAPCIVMMRLATASEVLSVGKLIGAIHRLSDASRCLIYVSIQDKLARVQMPASSPQAAGAVSKVPLAASRAIITVRLLAEKLMK